MEHINLHSFNPRRFETYRNDLTRRFCQVRLDSGERVLVSGAQGTVKLVRVALGGLLPIGTIATLDSAHSAQLARFFGPMLADSSYPFQHPLDMMAMMVAGMPSISDLKAFLARDPETQQRVVSSAVEGSKRAQAEWRRLHANAESRQE
jgi:hypothetical protein